MCGMAKFDHPAVSDLSLPRVLQALSDPIRLYMVGRLAAEGELTCGALGADRPKSSMSHHFRILRDAGVIRTRTEGTVHYNDLRIDDLNSRYPGLMNSVINAGSQRPPEGLGAALIETTAK